LRLRKGKFRKDEKGAIGIEILIVFIAIVLVAAVSAAVLIQTVGYLQQKATATGRETTKEVASGIKVLAIYGNVTPIPAGAVDKMGIIVTVNSGGQEIDLSKTTVTLSNGDKQVQYIYNSGDFYDAEGNLSDLFGASSGWPSASNSTKFGIIVLQDNDGSLTSGTPVLNEGDKAVLTINTADSLDNDASSNGIAERTTVFGEVRPEFGAPGVIDFTTPPSYTDAVIQLQ
jgi:flagellin FlaB